MDRRVNRVRLIVGDIILINFAYILAIYIRFDATIGNNFLSYLDIYFSNFIFITILKILSYYYFEMYRTIWKYASVKELLNIAIAVLVSNAMVLTLLFLRGTVFPRSIYAMVMLLDLVLIGGLRFSFRSINIKNLRYRFRINGKKRIMIIGAGDAGAMVLREFRNHTKLNSRVVLFIDDDPYKHRSVINGVPVIGGRDKISSSVKKYNIDEIIIAIPSAGRKNISDIIDASKQTKAKLRILPGIYELIDGNVSIKNIRDVEIQDILGREEVKVNLEEISKYISGKVVMVTGGGGSIGSELCRQVASFSPKKLILLDIYENTAYDVQNELKRRYKDLNLQVYIGSIRDKARMDEIIGQELPNVIFHAAAHKHVPLMEISPKEAIKNNVFGTLNLAQAADKFGVQKFVMISTDKAVNPTNIMGASKRICELIVQSLNTNSKTEFVSVRFGNVLGSNGSVVPLFKKQIEEGGPVTVTHEEVTRYFMTISEAVQLVIQAGAMAEGGEIFILDMGKPVKILDLAKDIIRFSGLEPYVDINIEITGLRPGEKLYEELLLDEEGVSSTKHDKIFIGKPIFTDYKLLLKSLDDLKNVVEKGTDEEVIQYVKAIVPTYKDSNEVNGQVIVKSHSQ